MVNENLNYLWTDAWLLLSIIVADQGTGTGLERIIAAGDGINHAIFTFEEIKGGFRRLIRGGYISESNGRFRATGKTKAEYKKKINKKRYLLDQMHLLEEFLNVGLTTSISNPKISNLNCRSVSKEMVKLAYKSYARTMRNLLRR